MEWSAGSDRCEGFELRAGCLTGSQLSDRSDTGPLLRAADIIQPLDVSLMYVGTVCTCFPIAAYHVRRAAWS